MSGNNGGMNGGAGMPYQGMQSPGMQNMGIQQMGMNQRIGGMPMQQGSPMATPQQAQAIPAPMPQAVPPAMNGGQQPMQVAGPQDMMGMRQGMRPPNRFNQY